MRVFLLFSIVGRMIWTSADLGLGYGFGVAIEAAADFPNSVRGLLVSLVISRRARIHDPAKSRMALNRSTLAFRPNLDWGNNSAYSSNS